MKRNLTLTLAFFLLGIIGLHAQCNNPGGFDFPAAPGVTSCDAVSFCNGEINGYCGQLGGTNVTWPFSLCNGNGVPNNMEWLAFAAAYTSMSLTITPFNCPGAGGFQGVQAGLYTACEADGGTPVQGACQTNCQTGPFILTANNLIVGNVYYLFIDGCAGDQCSYTITTDPPDATALPPLDPLNGPITGYTSVCPGATGIQYTVPGIPSVVGYNWILPPNWTYSTVSPGNTIIVDFPPDALSGQICVDAFNDCETTNPVCIDINVSPPPAGNDLGTYCEGGTFYYPADGQNYTSGFYNITLFQANWLGCDSLVNLTVTELLNTESYLEIAICQGDFYDVCGVGYDTGTQYIIDCDPNFQGCDSTINLDLYVLDPVAAIEPPEFLGCGINGSIYLDGFNSFGDTYWWETVDGDICDDPSNLFLEVCLPGTYCLTATSTHYFGDGSPAFSCTDQYCVTVEENIESPDVTVVSNDVGCPGDSNGSATITVNNPGVGPFTYDWNPNVSVTNTANNLAANTYSVTITAEGNNCTVVESITIGTPTAITINTTQNNIACNGGSTGDATAIPSGGTSPFTYLWCNNQITATATNLPPGDCQVVVTDNNGCTNSTTVTITEASAMAVSIAPTNVACNGDNTGSATASTTGGTTPFTYNWSNSQSGATATNLTAGTWTVTVTDNENCTSVESITLIEPGPVSVTTEQTDVLCNGDSDGTATATPSGGVGSFTYLWCNNQTSQTATGLSTGPCLVVVTDGNGCTSSAEVTIGAPSPVTVSATQSDVSCNGGSDGTATAIPSGGASPFTYEWCDNQTSPTATGLSAGPCSVIVTDANGCTSTTSVTLQEPTVLSLSTTQEDVECNGDDTGTATVIPSGGTGPYDYQWCTGGSNATENNLAAGTCSVIVTDDNGCSETITVTIQEASELEVEVAGNDLLCNGGTGSATATPSGGTGPYQYTWCDNSSDATATGLPAGTCSVIVTDDNGCTVSASVILTEPNAITVSATGTDVSCATSTDGEGTASASGGVAPFTYTWCNNQQGADATDLPVGPCEVIVTDDNGCTASTEILIEAPDALALSVSSEDVTCFGASNGTATVVASGGVGSYSYEWCDGQGTTTATGLDVGTCSVIVTDGNGCTETMSVTLSQPASALNITGTSEDAACGDDNGSISVTVTGGTTPYSYNWSNPAPDVQNPTNLAPGAYTLTVTDGNNCTSVFSINVNTPSGLAATALATPVSCNTGSDGTVSVTVQGGVGPYDYNWDNIPGNTPGGTDLPAGDYNVTITDDSGCTYVTSATVNEPAAIVIAGNSTDETCGETNGTISINVQGGTGPYTYNWTPGNIPDQNPTNLGAGNYNVIVTDANDCTASFDIAVNTPNALSLSTTSQDVSCNGDTDGSVAVTVTGGTAPFSYDWGGANPSNLGAGTYTLILTDDTDCSVTTSVVINEPAALSMTSTMEQATCGDGNGTITVVPSGGVAPYSYVWSNSNMTDNPTDLVPGDYFVTITDGNDCELIQSVEVTEPAALSLSISSTMTSCFGGSDGSIDLEVAGGTMPFTYDWGGPIVQDPDNLPAGTNTVIVTDNNGCTATTSITVGQPSAMEVSGGSTDALCGDDNGSISVSTVGGTSPYTYVWSGGADPVSNPMNLGPGTYVTTVTDNNGCTTEFSIDVNTPTGLSLSAVATDEPCNGESVGTIDLEVLGGVAPFSYSWSNSAGPYGGDTQDLTDLPADTYQVIVTDDTGCTIVTSATVEEPEALALSGTILEAACGDPTGGISLTVTGGTMPYSYDWDLADDVQNPTGLAAGDYVVIVTDANNCTATYATTVTEPEELLASATQVDVSCNGGSDGSINLQTTGGTMPFTYQWTGGSVEEDPSGLPAGTVTGVVTDANGCQAEVTMVLTEPEAIAITDTSEDASCGDANGSIDLTVTGGTEPYSYDWDTAPDVEDPSGLLAGNYSVIVTDFNGCTAEYSTVVSTPNALTLAAVPTDAACNGSSTGSIDLTVSGGVGPFTYDWPGWNGEDLSDVPAGTYTVIVTDATDCSVTLTEVINEPTAIAITGTSTDALCGQNDGTIDITVTGGTLPYTYDWGITDVEDPSNLGIGNYTVIVTDGNGCTEQYSITVNTPNGLALVESSSDASCNGGSDGTASVTVNGGTPPFTFAWTGGGDTDMITDLPAGTYVVTVTDDDGCTVVSSSVITQPAAIVINGNSVQETCDDSNGSVNISVNGGTGAYSYLWTPGDINDQNPTGLTAGDYTVVVTDINGCTGEAQFTVTEPTALTGGTNPTNVSCNGGSDGSISPAIFGGVGPYSYLWMPGSIPDQIPTGLPMGNYTLVVTDANGCTLQLQQALTEPTPIDITGTSTDALCGDTNGTISLTVDGGTPPYSYDWDNAADVQNPSNLGAGSYTVTVTDDNDCTEVYSINVNTPSMLQVTAAPTDALCFGSVDGSATSLVMGGTAPFTYEWSNASTDADLTGVAAGTYQLSVTDNTDCTVTTSVVIGEPEALDITGSSTDALCNQNNGTITIDVTGGTMPYSYDWSNGSTDQNPTNLGPGNFIVTITDGNGCTETFTQSVMTPDQVTLSSTSAAASCNGDANGTITLTTTGGIAPFTFLWSNGETTQNVSGLLAGTYTVTVTDNTGCTFTAAQAVSEPDQLATSTLVPTNINCNGGADGRVTLVVTGGTMPYSYAWSNGSTSDELSGVGAGTYTVTVTDINNCETTLTEILTEPTAIALSSASTSTGCSNTADGSIALTSTGGTAPYTYDWSNGSTDQNPSGLAAGTYVVVVTDANGCTEPLTAEVDAPEMVSLNLSSISEFSEFNVSCSGSSDGSATVLATGGTPTYTYSWSNGAVGATAEDLSAGSYTVIVTDANGCSQETQVTLEAPEEIFAATIVQDLTCFGDNDGAIIIDSVTGGSQPHMYSLDGGEFNQHGLFASLLAGTYELTVQDANGCEQAFNQTITEPAEVQVNLSVVGGDNEIQLGDSLLIRVQINTDTSKLQYSSWTQGDFWMDPGCDTCHIRKIFPLESTTYGYRVVDEQGCNGRDELLVKVIKDRPIYIPNAFSPNGDGNNDYFQIYIGAGVKKVNFFKVYNRWGEIVYELSDFFLMAPEQGWNGMFKGDMMNPAVFVYWAEVEFIDGHVELYKGDVSLVR